MPPAVDVVLCVDVTLSMGPLLTTVKHSALSVPLRLTEEIDSPRLKVIGFRDFGDEADDAIVVSPFFDVPAELDCFEKTVAELEAAGGGDEAESGLEALAVAMLADRPAGRDRRRQVIVLFTDAPAHPLGDLRQRSAHTYPPEIPTSLDALRVRWCRRSADRLLIFAPETYPWTEIAQWNHTAFFPSNAGEGLDIVATIAASL
ncbi:vWA domain-containing protein [Actinocrispum wychmicini]|uniref:VWFA domain-containing protein n=1 Tax=Actinocrispum wychmicini TaxID=1213861 RepID=A0A4R2IUX4_9PSEU|nr:vWA domain-containing protein [Actinocrispum wychmicini]TCO48917.1 hypothetical protein EV192_115138 [Actinocrispum wychmicini]